MFSSLCLPANAFDAIETGSNDSFQETLLQEFERTKSIRVQNMLAYINDIENQLTTSSEYTELLNEDTFLRTVIIPFKECTCGKH